MLNNVITLNAGNRTLPQVKRGRTKHNLSHTSHTDINVGLLYPLDAPMEVVPGDTFNIKQRTIVRMSNPPQVPVMDTLRMDIYYFYVPYRVIWNDWDKFIANDNGTDWDSDISVTFPTLTFSSDAGIKFPVGSLADFLGFSPNVTIPSGKVSILPFRGYYKIWNDYFRYEPLQQSISESYGASLFVAASAWTSAQITGGLSYSYHISNYKTGIYSSTIALALAPVNRLGDYFSRCLPKPSKGEDVLLNLSIPESFDASTLPSVNGLFSGQHTGDLKTDYDFTDNVGSYANLYGMSIADYGSSKLQGFANLYGGSVSDLINAFAVYKLQTTDARYGSRIVEFTQGHYGVNVPDERVDRAELIGWNHFDLNVNQVTQTSSTASTEYLGTPGATSVTNHFASYVNKSFVEFGLIYCLGCVRVKHHTYAQGVSKLFSKVNRFDYYFNEFANLVDQPVYAREIYATFTTPADSWDTEIWGYNEVYADYKYIPSRVSHHMRPDVSNTLAVWTYTDNYTSTPYFSESWLYEPQSNVDRTMFLTASETVSQFIVDAGFFIDAYREVPLHSQPASLVGIM